MSKTKDPNELTFDEVEEMDLEEAPEDEESDDASASGEDVPEG